MTTCLLTFEDIWPDGLPESDALIAQLRTRVHRDGICAEDFRLLAGRGDEAFQLVFGENVLVKIEFDVARIGEHSHLVHVAEAGRKPEVITAYPEAGELRVLGPMPWGESPHSPMRQPRGTQRVGVIARDFGQERWRKVTVLARAIDEARLNYNFLFQNSNSVVATLANAAETGFVDLPGGGLNLGHGNLLYDELMGGRQVSRFLVQGGTSYSAGSESPVPDALPQSANTEG
ncbi:hypothetical protein [Henriciella barbarensis]|uniref:hypothetical protein n=1 Tax=Henriciella barbarensis TaxID=86342 RepID=UPI0011C46500|nr:hypothetical protein [Henriciella barbarensis]